MRQGGPEYAGALSLLSLGVTLGPSGLGVLTPQLLALVDPAIPVGLTGLGVLAALDIDIPSRDTQLGRMGPTLRDVGAAAAVASVMVALGLALMLDGYRLWAVAGVAGTCALATRSRHGAIPILLGALSLAWTRGGALATWNVGNTVVVSAGCAVIGWLMLRRQSSVAEQRGAIVAILLLIGGAADYLSVSALLGGLAAGTCWRLIGGTTRESVRREVTYLRHAVLAILLLTAGARTELTAVTIGLGIGYATISAALSEVTRALAPVIAAGSNILAIGLALSASRLWGPEMALPLTAVVVGTMLLQALAISRGRREAFE
jgi:hypothetical protein